MFYIDLDMKCKMMINIKKRNITSLCTALITAFIFMPIESFAQSNESSKPKKQTTYKKARVLQTKTAKEMAKFYEAYERVKIIKVKDTDKNSETFGQMIDKEEPDPDWVTAKSILTKKKHKNGTERIFEAAKKLIQS